MVCDAVQPASDSGLVRRLQLHSSIFALDAGHDNANGRADWQSHGNPQTYIVQGGSQCHAETKTQTDAYADVFIVHKVFRWLCRPPDRLWAPGASMATCAVVFDPIVVGMYP